MKTIIALCMVCLPLKSLTVTSPFGYRIHPLTGQIEYHNGVDLRAKYDTVYAVLNGVVRSVCSDSSFGTAINLEHGEINTIYGHLRKSLVNAEDSVNAGQPIAISGASGQVTAAHLHFSVRYKRRYLNPLNFLYEIIKTTIMSKNFKPLHEQIANKLIAELKEGTSPFQKPWNDSDAPAFTIPVNPTTNKNYRGMNALWLSMQGYKDPRWMTLKQADYAGFTVEKGAKATLINFVKTSNMEAMRDVNGDKIKDENGQTQTRVTALDKPIITNAWVFNAEQIKGVPPLAEYLAQNRAEQKWTPIEKAENLLAASQANINHGGNEAYYNKTKDAIQLPFKEQFDNQTKYYAVALHELGHWSGHESRLNRPMEGRFGSEQYAREELRAEIASLMIGSELKIGHNFGQHAAYVNSWVKILKDEPFELFRASADAQKIYDFVLDLGEKRDLKQENKVTQENTIAEKGGEVTTLAKGDEITYNNNVYKVLDLKGKTFKMEDMDGNKFNLKQTDGLFKSLVGAKNNPAEQQLVVEEAAAEVSVSRNRIGR